jgi:TRAP-type uncharacterized transport system substrate-binding protein
MRSLIMAVGALLAAALILWLGRDLPPPRTVTFAAGGEGGGYWTLAQRYREILARDGIDVEVIATSGSVENAALLEEGAADIGLIQGGVAVAEELTALGAVFIEPLFLLRLADGPNPQRPEDWRGLRVAAGPEGSGTRAAFGAFSQAIQLAPGEALLEPLSGADAAAALLEGRVDVAAFVAPVSAPYLAPLFAAESVRLVDLDMIHAVARRMAEAEVVQAPPGAISLEPPRPEDPVDLIAMTASLVAQPDFHPALIDRFVEAARIIHSRRDALTDEGAFPATRNAALPVNSLARRLIEEGPSQLTGVLPWWIAAQIDRVLILLVPILLLATPLLRSAPALYNWRMRRRIWRYYDELRTIEAESRETHDPAALEALAERIETVDSKLAALDLPVSFRDNAFTARIHADFLRRQLETRRGRPAAGGIAG